MTDERKEHEMTDAELKRGRELAEAWLKPSPVVAENEVVFGEQEMARLLLKAVGELERMSKPEYATLADQFTTKEL